MATNVSSELFVTPHFREGIGAGACLPSGAYLQAASKKRMHSSGWLKVDRVAPRSASFTYMLPPWPHGPSSSRLPAIERAPACGSAPVSPRRRRRTPCTASRLLGPSGERYSKER